MPISRPTQTPSEAQLEKAKRCVVFQNSPIKSTVWDPKPNTYHVVENGECDCPGFSFHGYCAHICAVELKEKRGQDMSFEQAVKELYDL